MIEAIFACLAVGLVAGFLAGLLGVGGGLVIVPALLWVFHLIGVLPEVQQHLAIGTSLATIIFTGMASVRAHHLKGAVRWDVVRRITPGILLGTFVGAQIAYLVAAQMLLDFKPKPTRQLPKIAAMTAMGGLIGVVSSWVGIGGGSLSVPFLSHCNVPVKTAIATSSAIGVPIAIAGALGFIVSGWSTPSLPSGSLGFVYLPALLGIVIASFPMAKVGAAAAHRLPVPVLKKCFAALLIILACKMLLSLL